LEVAGNIIYALADNTVTLITAVKSFILQGRILCNEITTKPTKFLFFFSDPEGCSLLDPAVEAVPSPGGGQEVVPVGHDPAVQQQQREQTNCFTG
jgi:hypothetical protein